MRKALFSTALILAVAVTGMAHASDEKPVAEREVYICDTSDLTRRSFEREFGRQVFVTADEVMKAAREQQAWAAPRCITRAEHVKLETAIAQREQAIILSARDQ